MPDHLTSLSHRATDVGASSKRDQLIDAALELFYENGFHATGIDRILAKAGVAKMTLYKHFPSKEALIEAVLRHRSDRFRAWLKAYIEAHADTPRDRLLAVFDAFAEWLASDDFRGCLFLNASAEFAGISEAVTEIAREHKAALRADLAALAREAGCRAPEELAEQLDLLMEGAIVLAQLTQDPSWARTARNAATTIVDTL